jgi:hypothetical protein
MTLQAAISRPDEMAFSLLCVILACLIAIQSGGAVERARKRSLVLRNKTTTLVGAALLWALAIFAQKDPQPPPPTNPPPSSAQGVIRLYWHAPDGRLVPFDPPIREAAQ